MADKPRGATPPNPPRRDPLAERMERVADLLSRLPDAIAGAVANATSRRPAPATAGDPDAPHADHGAGLFSAISRVVPGLQRFLDRENRDATRPAADPLDAFASLLRRSQRGGASPDWTAVLARFETRFGPHSGGPAGASFAGGDVAEEIRRRRKEQDDARAARFAMWGSLKGQGYRPYSQAEELAALASGATVVGQAAPGMPGSSPVGASRFPAPPRPSWAARTWADLTAAWRASGADFRHFARHPWFVTKDWARGAWRTSRGWADRFGQTGFARATARGAAAYRQFWQAPWRNTAVGALRGGRWASRAARSFGHGFRRESRGLGASWAAGRNALASRKAAWHYRRRAQVNAARFSRGVSEAFGAGSTAFQRFAGAGRMAAASLSSLAGTAGLAATMLGRTRDAVALPVAAMVALRNFAEERFESNRRYGMYNPAVSFAYARTEAEDMRRNWQTARENEGAIVTLTRSVNAMRDALRPSESLVTGLGTRGGIASSEVVASAGRLLNRAFVDDANRALNAADPNGSGTQEWAQWGMRGVHWAAGGAAGFFGNLFNSVLGNPSAGLADQMSATAKDWLEAEKLGQLASKVGPVPLWHQQLNKIAAIDRPFLPPREVRPPGRRP